jgi:uncharacterized BrkB/YihY/UPF0761 family membrane protein
MLSWLWDSVVGRFAQKMLDDRAPTLAALVAWGMLNTILPLVLSALSLATLLLGSSDQVVALENTILKLLPAPD